MPLAVGQSLTHYEILGPLGAGGMGEVYRARDTRLEREVAIKVLPEHFADDEERLRRFEREAKTLASLHHPNVASIFGIDQVDDTCFLAMELVPGEDLAAKLARGPLPVDEAVDLCRQIAEGLEAAHEAGVVHRDLKPANVRVTPDGVVKILDFGLAKPLHPKSGKEGTTTAESDSFLVTEEGLVLGTPTYMSPEQARGKPVDKRTDVWAFGCVLFECLAGKRLFAGASIVDVLGAIVGVEPDWSAIPAHTPASVRQLLRRALAKDPRRRLRDIGDARIVLEECREGVLDAIPAEPIRRGPLGLVVTLVAFVALVVGALLARGLWPSSARVGVARTPLVAELTAPGGTRIASVAGPPALSSDGKRLAFVAVDERGDASLWVRELDGTAEARRIPGTENAQDPFWAPDGQRLGFRSGRDLLTIGVDENRPQLLVRGGPGSDIRGAAWNEDEVIVFADRGKPLMRVDARGGTPDVLLDPAPDRAGAWPTWPAFLPDGKGFLFTIHDTGGEVSGLYVGELGSLTVRKLLPDLINAAYVEPGWIVHRRGDALYATAFDARTRVFGEESVRIAKDVRVSEWPAHAHFAASRDGRVVYFRQDADEVESDFVWFDIASGEVESLGVEGILWNPRLSHDGKRLAFDRTSQQTGGDIWVRDLERGSELRLTEAASDDSDPVWAPEDDRIYFHMTPDLYSTNPSGVGAIERILQSPETKFTVDVSADGGTLLWANDETTELFALDLETRESTLVRKNADYSRFSPDGAWLAVVVRATTDRFVMLQTYPGGEQVTRISPGSGAHPRWTPAGDEILFASEGEVVAVPVEFRPGAAPVPGAPRVVVPRTGPNQYRLGRGFEIAPDGKRLLLIRSLASDTGALTVLENAVPDR